MELRGTTVLLPEGVLGTVSDRRFCGTSTTDRLDLGSWPTDGKGTGGCRSAGMPTRIGAGCSCTGRECCGYPNFICGTASNNAGQVTQDVDPSGSLADFRCNAVEDLISHLCPQISGKSHKSLSTFFRKKRFLR